MIKNVCICDRCKRELSSETAYRVQVFQFSYNGNIASDVANGLANAFAKERHLCGDCKEDLEQFLNGGLLESQLDEELFEEGLLDE